MSNNILVINLKMLKFLLMMITINLYFGNIKFINSQTSCNFAGYRGCAGSNICAYNTLPTINATYCIKWTSCCSYGSFCGYPPIGTPSPIPLQGCPKCGLFTRNPYFCYDATDGCVFWDDYYQMCTSRCDRACKEKLEMRNNFLATSNYTFVDNDNF